MAKTEDILAIEQSVEYMQQNMPQLYPVGPKGKRKTVGNLPEGLHAALFEFAKSRNISAHTAIAVLLDFHEEYEALYSDELTTQRDNNRR